MANAAGWGRIAAAALFVSGTLAGCAGGAAPARELTTRTDGAGLPTYSYPLSGGDKLRVIVFGDPQLGGDFTIGGSGYISLPLIGEVEATGLTSTQLGQRISAKLAQGYLKEPRVAVEVLAARPFYILGEVNKPGEYPFTDGLTIEAAVARAGGYTYRATTKSVAIKRAGEVDSRDYALTPGTRVAPGDTIRIKERWF